MSNAVKYSPNGIRIGTFIEIESEEHGNIMLTLDDAQELVRCINQALEDIDNQKPKIASVQ